jgi:hypothetical protein
MCWCAVSRYGRVTGMNRPPCENVPDVRDGLTRLERVVLHVLAQTQRERGGRAVPTAMLYGRVLEYVDVSEAELQECLRRLNDKDRGGESVE